VIIKTSKDLGTAIRRKRKQDGLSLMDAAALCNVGYRFLSDLENGKPTVRMEKVLQVIKMLGLHLELKERAWPDEG
jgi:y4mF family transcriptional regulator